MRPRNILAIGLALAFIAQPGLAQNKNPHHNGTGRVHSLNDPFTVQNRLQIIEEKNYYLLSQLQNDPAAAKLISTDPVLSQLAHTKTASIRAALTGCKETSCFTGSLKLGEQEIKTIGERLSALYKEDNALGKLISQKLIPSGAYSLYKNLSKKELLVKAWEQDASGINHTVAVYAEGAKPNYPDIDSISFSGHQKGYEGLVSLAASTIFNETQNTSLFFLPAMHAAVLFLDLNDRPDVANYEPMAATVNKAALLKSKNMLWSKYPYSLILVPGEGPDDFSVQISPIGKLRCRLAATQYFNGQAPFIMVSGGKVHPYKTPYCEAEEMKKYLVQTLGLPESAVFLEPHARHTTTNMRNAARLIYQYHLPADKPAIVVTDKFQSAYISKLEGRCMRELHDVPYKLGKRLSDTEQEFYPVWEAMQINQDEPLDP